MDIYFINRAIKELVSRCIFTYRKFIKFSMLKHENCRILMYHSINNVPRENDRMGLAVSGEIFRVHMRYLKENRFNVIGLFQLIEKIEKRYNIPEKSIVITFDDGYKGVLTYALPVLKEFGFTATVFVNIHFIERKLRPEQYWYNWPTLTWDDVRILYAEGLSIGSHAFTHKRLTNMNDEQLKTEVAKSKELIEKNINAPVDLFSYPHGSFNRRIIEVLRANNFLSACSSIEGANDSKSDVFILRRTEITAFDNTQWKFEKKLLGCYDWLALFM